MADIDENEGQGPSSVLGPVNELTDGTTSKVGAPVINTAAHGVRGDAVEALLEQRGARPFSELGR
eukprot:7708350-Lingulodinium_polyedra.AAC.1